MKSTGKLVKSKNALLVLEAKELKRKYDEQGNKDCYCGESSTSECPAHIEDYIRSLEWNEKE